MDDLAFAITNMESLLESAGEEANPERLDPEQALWMSTLIRRMGCGAFLMGGDFAPLFEGLFRSGELYLLLLEQLRERGEAGAVARSTSAPMVDALAAGAVDLARRIDALLPRAQVPDLEDDEDFAWYSTLHALGVGRLDRVQLSARADAFAAGSPYLETRGEILRTIADRDRDGFQDALARLTNDWHDAIEAEREDEITDRYADLTEWNLFLEGAALVRAARAGGVAVEASYPFIPAALLEEPPPFPAPLGEGG